VVSLGPCLARDPPPYGFNFKAVMFRSGVCEKRLWSRTYRESNLDDRLTTGLGAPVAFFMSLYIQEQWLS